MDGVPLPLREEGRLARPRDATEEPASARVTALRQNLIGQVCQGTGDNCTYMGKNMFDAHKGMNISEAELNVLVGDLVASLDKHKVPEKEKNELLGVLGPMKSDIVGKRSGPWRDCDSASGA